MQGEAIRIRAEAYEKMCQRDPDSILCKE